MSQTKAALIDKKRREKLLESTKGLFALGLIFVIPFLGKYLESKKTPEKTKAVWG